MSRMISITISMRMPIAISGVDANCMADRMRIAIHSDHILAISNTGVRVYWFLW